MPPLEGNRPRGSFLTFILHWKKVETGISDYPSPGAIKLKISCFFYKPTSISSGVEMKVVPLKLTKTNKSEEINQENLPIS